MLYIIRHGQTAKNKAMVLQGRSDVPLNDAGRQQAEDVRDRLISAGIHFDRVYTSPLIRAMQTTEIIVPGVEQVVERLCFQIFQKRRSRKCWKNICTVPIC